MTKVAITVFDDILKTNGTTVRVHRILELLKRQYDLTVIACSNEDTENLGKLGMAEVQLINIKGIGFKYLLSMTVPVLFKILPIFLWDLRLLFILLKNRFDIVYCAGDRFGFLSAYLVSKIRKYKVIFETHAVFSEESKEKRHSRVRVKLSQYLEQFIMKRADFTIALSSNTLEFYGAYNDNIALVPVFVDTDIFKARGRSGRTIGSKLVGLIGPFDTNNLRQMGSLRALYARINQFDSRVRFVIIGRCEERIENERIAYTGYLDSLEDYVTELSNLDVILNMERVATHGPLNKIIEPMSCSLPVFTTPKGMVGLYWLEPGKDIFVFEEDELVDKVNELIFNDELMTAVGRSARLVVEQYYSKRANEEKLVRILESAGDD